MDMGQKLLTSEKYIARATAVHGTTFDYSETIYSGGKERITIICKSHGAFTIAQAAKHLMGQGCPKCTGRLYVKSRTVEEFVADANARHGERYDYSLITAPVRVAGKGKIICLQHGVFSQNIHSHLNGRGCPKCNLVGWGREKWVARATQGIPILYIIHLFSDLESFYKIGITFRSVEERYSRGLPYKIKKIYKFEAFDAERVWSIERAIKDNKELTHYSPIQFFPGHSECFASLEELLLMLVNNLILL